jgi:microsomal dipeptidase-like Zn-dependent dipeptidase
LDGTQVYEVDFSNPYLNSYDRWKHVARRLHDRGFGREDIQKILGLNFKRILSQVLDP